MLFIYFLGRYVPLSFSPVKWEMGRDRLGNEERERMPGKDGKRREQEGDCNRIRSALLL